jgi:hypothetical protein
MPAFPPPQVTEAIQILKVWGQIFPYARFMVHHIDEDGMAIQVTAYVWVSQTRNAVVFDTPRPAWKLQAKLDRKGHATYTLAFERLNESEHPVTTERPEATRRSRGLSGAIGWASYVRTKFIGDESKALDFRGWDGSEGHGFIAGYIVMPKTYEFLRIYGWCPWRIQPPLGTEIPQGISPWSCFVEIEGCKFTIMLMRPEDPKDMVCLIHTANGYPPGDILDVREAIEEEMAKFIPVEPPTTATTPLGPTP